MPSAAPGREEDGMRTLDWSGLLPVLLGFMGARVMVQVWDAATGAEEQPVLAAFGRLAGGPVGALPDSDAVTLSLTNDAGASSGLLMLRESGFVSAGQRTPGALRIRLRTTDVQIVRAAGQA